VNPRVARVIVIIVGCALFGVTMGLRSQVQPRWAKNSVAGVAGAIMGLTLAFAWRRP
jgi:cytochrome c biogenesis protein CcdA